MMTVYVVLGVGYASLLRSVLSLIILLINATVTEPFICPALYEKYVNKSSTPVVDEWTLSVAMGGNLAQEMEEHYNTFIVRDASNTALALWSEITCSSP
jgi:hypothetical protein